ncbi:MAG: SH3 domain-containing protein [Defluviitaleaceae bacterium]|nr:SH3 domain-containing protein [Defluviitaleaceae bacterium]
MLKKIILVGLLLTIILLPVAAYADESLNGGYIDDVWASEWEIFEMALIQEPTVFITTARLNLRPGPSTSYDRLAVVSQGRRVEVLDFGCGQWYRVSYDGTIGYMYALHLREIPEPGQQPHGTVELLEWRYARNLMSLGTQVTLIDVRTGLSWQMASFSNGNHADVEPITSEDTATMLQAFGSWTWTPRPVLVLVNGRTIAASINGMPHGGSTRSGNNMNGHLCLYFYGSASHRYAPGHVRDHHNAIREAFNTASAW